MGTIRSYCLSQIELDSLERRWGAVDKISFLDDVDSFGIYLRTAPSQSAHAAYYISPITRLYDIDMSASH